MHTLGNTVGCTIQLPGPRIEYHIKAKITLRELFKTDHITSIIMTYLTVISWTPWMPEKQEMSKLFPLHDSSCMKILALLFSSSSFSKKSKSGAWKDSPCKALASSPWSASNMSYWGSPPLWVIQQYWIYILPFHMSDISSGATNCQYHW